MTVTAEGTDSRTDVSARPLDWVAICRLEDLVPERGAAARVGGEQVAVFRLLGDQVLAVAQLDPFSGAHVIARGIVGSRGDAPTIASPMHKQVFDLRTGRCLDALGGEPRHLRSWPTRIVDGVVSVRCPAAGDGAPVDERGPS